MAKTERMKNKSETSDLWSAKSLKDYTDRWDERNNADTNMIHYKKRRCHGECPSL